MELIRTVKQFARDEEGLAAIEYALIGSLVAVGCVVGAGALGTALNNMFTALATRMRG